MEQAIHPTGGDPAIEARIDDLLQQWAMNQRIIAAGFNLRGVGDHTRLAYSYPYGASYDKHANP